MFHNTLLLVLFYLFSLFGQTQVNNPTNYRSPLDIPLVLAANFGELRPNHFHMGVDFKTNGVEGLKLYAIENGFVSRVKISPYGYGKVIYIDHPDGITSVYAHCSAFTGKLDSIVKLTQEKEQNFEIEIFFTPTDILVKKGDVIALSGNTGGSTAPHLHFELRDTKSEDALNPLLYGFKIADHKSPAIKGLKVYALNEKGYQIPGKSKIVGVLKNKDSYSLPGSILQIPADYCSENGGIGFSFDVVDYFDGALNVCGLYGSTLKAGEDTVFCQQIDQVSFDHSRYVNTHKDYLEYTQSKRKYHKSFRSEHNPLTIYPKPNLGVLKVKPGDSLDVHYHVYDVKGNKSALNFVLKVQKGEINYISSNFSSNKYFLPDSAYHFQNEQIEFYAHPYTFYEPTLKSLSLKPPFSFGDAKQPIQNPIGVKLKLPPSQIHKSKFYISVKTASNKTRPLISQVEGEWISAESKYLGTFQIAVDTIAPSLSPLNFNGLETSVTKTRMTWKVKENQTELEDYDLFIDGKWYLLEYESKGDYLFFDRPKGMVGKHKMEVIVVDSMENKRVWSMDVKF